MKRNLLIFWNVVILIPIAAVILLAVMLLGFRIVGLRVFTVDSPSMEPAYREGSLLCVRPVDTADIRPGTVITYLADPDTLITHRVTEVIRDAIEPTDVFFRTRGDANAYEDETLAYCKNVVGRPVFAIPYLGAFLDRIQTPPASWLAVICAVVLLVLLILFRLLQANEGVRRPVSRLKRRLRRKGNTV